MNTPLKSTLAVAAVAGMLTGAYVPAEKPVEFDYTGLPVFDTEVETVVQYTTIPASLKLQGCEVVENADDYTGAEMTRCDPKQEEPGLDWSYLY